MTLTYDIVIPHYGVNPELNLKLLDCLMSIAYNSADCRVILVDNGSPDLDIDAIKKDIRPVLAQNSNAFRSRSRSLSRMLVSIKSRYS